MKCVVTTTLATTILAGMAYGRMADKQTADPLQFDRVVLFKNGFGFFVADAPLPAQATESMFRLPAVPVQGTFWLSYPPDVNLTRVVAEKVEAEGERLEAVTIPEILRANVGKRVRLTIDQKQITGTIEQFTADRREPIILPYTPGVPEHRPEQREIWPPYEAGLALIYVDGKTLSLDPREVKHVTFLDQDVQTHFRRTTDGVAIHVRTAEAAEANTLTASFLAKGIVWVPSYLVDISAEKEARLSAKALIVNEIYDLNDVTVQLATGFPRLQFADVRSPVGMKEPLDQFLRILAGREQEESRPMRRYAMAEMAPAGFGGAAMDMAPAYGAAEAGITTEDLFLYPAGRITLEPDSVAYVALFTETVPYEDLYRWTIPDYVDEAGRFLFRGDQSDDEKEQEVWHTIRLENSTQAPWTPAPAEVVTDNTILGQDSMRYTPSGDEASLRVSRAGDIQAEQEEFEAERQRDVIQRREIPYDLVTVRGELTVVNYKERAVMLEIAKTLSGEVVSSDPEAEITRLAAGIQRMNGLRKLTWNLEIGPGETREVTYTYEVYVRGEQGPATRTFRSRPEPALR